MQCSYQLVDDWVDARLICHLPFTLIGYIKDIDRLIDPGRQARRDDIHPVFAQAADDFMEQAKIVRRTDFQDSAQRRGTIIGLNPDRGLLRGNS